MNGHFGVFPSQRTDLAVILGKMRALGREFRPRMVQFVISRVQDKLRRVCEDAGQDE